MRDEMKTTPQPLSCCGALSRREMLSRATNGFGLFALHALLAEQSRAEEASSGAARTQHRT